jgi:transketolase
MTETEIRELQIQSYKLRKNIMESVYLAKSGHPGGSLSIVEALVYLYYKEMRIDPENPLDENRDRFVLSKGHGVPALYATLASRGFFPMEWLKTLRQIGSPLQGHPKMQSVPGIEMSTGSLGQGISAACGMAKAAKYLGQDEVRVYTLLGDGECQEGEVWEALHFASHYALDNLCVIIDWNQLQIDGRVDDVMNLRRLDQRLEACGFQVQVIDGHNFEELEQAFHVFHETKDRPTAIALKTIKGCGVSYMEDAVAWHGKVPKEEEYQVAMAELDARLAKLQEETAKEVLSPEHDRRQGEVPDGQ